MIRVLRLPMVMDRTGVARSTIYLWMNQGQFPRQIKLGERTVAWVEDEIEQWLTEKIAARH